MRPPQGKFSTDLYWNAGAFGLSALLGVLINLLIVRAYDAAALGVFNLVYAVYILLSQLAVGGVHLAVQAFVPREIQQGRRPDVYLSAALVLSTATSLVVMAAAWWGRELPGRWFDSAAVVAAFPLAIGGLLFFSWNKVLLSFHNGARRMRLFAVFQLLRFTFLFLMLAILVWRGAPPEQLPLVLAGAEMLLFLLLLPVTLRWWSPLRTEGLRGALGRGFRFGNRALLGNILLDVNTRVDVFMLGIFLSDAMVGLYSFAATVAEGLMQLPVLFRNNINPVITRAWHQGGQRLLGRVVTRNRRAFFRLLAPLVVLTVPLFPVALWVLGMKEEPMTVWALYAILAAGIALTSGHQPFLMLFSQLEHPGWQTVFIFLVFLSNVVFNLLLIPWLGVYGAAIGTALSFFTLAMLMRVLARRVFNISIR
ncbi:MAG: polysaccharide biosynthesis C-terminal domain-containing protein [Flavobacteriales bacterium]|nr:polysaccharide biosynthesis C-terminal domain-containing protein [Flavobacteriales bacterium]